jgi:hypothetical protein
LLGIVQLDFLKRGKNPVSNTRGPVEPIEIL